MLTIGSHTLPGRALLAPMAGVTDAPLRRLCAHYGAALTTSEMVTSDISMWKSEKSRFRLPTAEHVLNEHAFYCHTSLPVSIQIAGSDPGQLALAAKAAVAQGADIVDINMGCPAKKVCKKLAGSALLKDEILVGRILDSVVNSVSVPVTLKTRTGWDEDQKNGVRIARLAQDAGIQALCIHGRTRACRFNGHAEYDTIADIVAAVSIPVIANGDIASAAKANEVLAYTGAAAVMIGRAALGQPWLFKKISDTLAGKPDRPIPLAEQCQTLLDHIRGLHIFYGDVKGVRIARKHVMWYMDAMSAVFEKEKSFTIKKHKKHFNMLNEKNAQIDFIQTLCEPLHQRKLTLELNHEELAA